MTGKRLGRLIYNTGEREEIVRKDFKFPLEERIGLAEIIRQAKSDSGAELAPNVHLCLETQSDMAGCLDMYTASFFYGTPDNNEEFFVSFGAKSSHARNYIWPGICKVMTEDYSKEPPFNFQPAAPLVIDVFLPFKKFDAMAFLYKSNCYDFCTRLGWALLYPECIRD